MELSEYRKKVIECIANPECDDIVLNNNIEHATILIEQMFIHGVEKISLLSTSLDSRLYAKENVISAIKEFLSKDNTTLNIVTEESICPQKNHELLVVFKQFENKVNCKKSEKWLSDQYNYNFLIADDATYRFEEDKKNHEASAGFHDTVIVEKLTRIFNNINKLAVS